jgi:serine/threonine protein kinase
VPSTADPELHGEGRVPVGPRFIEKGTLDQPTHGLVSLGSLARVLQLTVITPGTQIGPYKIEGPLGAGGMGEVFRAVDAKFNRLVAIKFLSARLADAAASSERRKWPPRSITRTS